MLGARVQQGEGVPAQGRGQGVRHHLVRRYKQGHVLAAHLADVAIKLVFIFVLSPWLKKKQGDGFGPISKRINHPDSVAVTRVGDLIAAVQNDHELLPPELPPVGDGHLDVFFRTRLGAVVYLRKNHFVRFCQKHLALHGQLGGGHREADKPLALVEDELVTQKIARNAQRHERRTNYPPGGRRIGPE